MYCMRKNRNNGATCDHITLGPRPSLQCLCSTRARPGNAAAADRGQIEVSASFELSPTADVPARLLPKAVFMFRGTQATIVSQLLAKYCS